MSNVKSVHTDKAPSTIGPYSQATLVDGWVFSAGQIGLIPETGALAGTDVVSQTRQVFRNLAAVLEAAGASLGDVVKTTVFLADMDEFAIVNAIYAEHFTEPYPARSTVQAARLPKNARVEIEVVARLP